MEGAFENVNTDWLELDYFFEQHSTERQNSLRSFLKEQTYNTKIANTVKYYMFNDTAVCCNIFLQKCFLHIVGEFLEERSVMRISKFLKEF